MSILCWNCHELENPLTMQELNDLIWAQDPIVVFIAEIWLDEARLVGLREKLNFWFYLGGVKNQSWRWFGSVLEARC